MGFLCKVTEEHRVNSEAEAARYIEEAKKDGRFILLKSSTVYKTVKEKKEIVDEFWITTLVKQFTDPKCPDCTVSVSYDYTDGAFPEPYDLEEEGEEGEY